MRERHEPHLRRGREQQRGRRITRTRTSSHAHRPRDIQAHRNEAAAQRADAERGADESPVRWSAHRCLRHHRTDQVRKRSALPRRPARTATRSPTTTDGTRIRRQPDFRSSIRLDVRARTAADMPMRDTSIAAMPKPAASTAIVGPLPNNATRIPGTRRAERECAAARGTEQRVRRLQFLGFDDLRYEADQRRLVECQRHTVAHHQRHHQRNVRMIGDERDRPSSPDCSSPVHRPIPSRAGARRDLPRRRRTTTPRSARRSGRRSPCRCRAPTRSRAARRTPLRSAPSTCRTTRRGAR